MYQRLPSWNPRYGASVTGSVMTSAWSGVEVEVTDRRVLGGQPARGEARRDHRVDRQRVVEPLRELQPGLDPLHELLSRYRVTLFDQFPGQRRRRGARGVGPGDADVAALRGPVVVHLANKQLRRAVRSDAPLEAAVGGDVELAIVERRLADGHVVVGVLAAEHLKAQVGGGAALTGDDVLVARLHPGAEVQGVRVVEAHLGERPGARLHERMVAVVVERQVGAPRDAPGQILQTLQQIGFGFDERCGGDQLLGLGDRVGQWLGVHP